jgi:hypothetical protein
MRHVFAGILALMCVVTLCAFSVAENQMGIRDTYKVNFSQQVLVGNTVLPAGNYEIHHVMEGSNHIMIFQQLQGKKSVEVRVKCTLVPLTAKAVRDEKEYALNASNQWVLQELVFRGDRAKHVF